MSLARTERAALADLLLETGPDRPTLCEGWTTGDLLAHLLVRERRPDAAVGMFVPPLHRWTEVVSRGYRTRPWAEQVQMLRGGPPRWAPFGWGPIDELANSGEMFIHHEDARRGVPGWQPRSLAPDVDRELRTVLSGFVGRTALRRSPVGVTAVPTGPAAGDPVVLRRREPVVTVTGAPGDLVLWVTGRDAVDVELSGPPDAVAAATSARHGL
ncbi:TIGR03085 family metal-binding protein [Nakamurella endophytica]|uniref:TIGR03085 family protein n=1 Tax=Nakamurella endophytica TaxID=1748367 RepID=A0A917STQ7_9ACTN|nr:TIGR03085 family metal-binding protein [Nakamurella endophytica]GGL95215.1 TIGR03085 family protein [Nakamurella endophytica]